MKVFCILIALIATVTASAKPEKVLIDTTKSTIKWRGGKEFASDSHTGTIAIKSGYVEIENGNISGGEIVIDMNKIENTDLPDPAYKAKLVGHLQSADFFDTKMFQTATYKITKVSKTSDTFLFEGDLNLKGKVNPLKVNTNVAKADKVYSAKGTTDFDRTKFDVKYSSKAFFPDLIKTGKDKIIKNNIDLEFDLKTIATNQ